MRPRAWPKRCRSIGKGLRWNEQSPKDLAGQMKVNNKSTPGHGPFARETRIKGRYPSGVTGP